MNSKQIFGAFCRSPPHSYDPDAKDRNPLTRLVLVFQRNREGFLMRKLAFISAVTLCLGSVGVSGAQAQGYGYGGGYRDGYGRGYDRGYGRHRDYGYRRHRGLSTGAAVGLGIAGAAAGAAAAGAFDRGGPGYYGRGY